MCEKEFLRNANKLLFIIDKIIDINKILYNSISRLMNSIKVDNLLNNTVTNPIGIIDKCLIIKR